VTKHHLGAAPHPQPTHQQPFSEPGRQPAGPALKKGEFFETSGCQDWKRVA
jgi:hypothetical protein